MLLFPLKGRFPSGFPLTFAYRALEADGTRLGRAGRCHPDGARLGRAANVTLMGHGWVMLAAVTLGESRRGSVAG